LPGLYFWPWNFDSGAIFFIVILIQQADCYLDSVYNFSHFSFEVLQDRLLGAASGRSGQRKWAGNTSELRRCPRPPVVRSPSCVRVCRVVPCSGSAWNPTWFRRYAEAGRPRASGPTSHPGSCQPLVYAAGFLS